MRNSIPIEDRFWQKVKMPLNPLDCWEWTAATRNGYGVIGRPRRGTGVEYAHRFSFEFFYEFIEDDREVCHKCNNRLCVNPYHLYEGTRSQNMRQAWTDGRGIVPNRWKPGTFHYNPFANDKKLKARAK